MKDITKLKELILEKVDLGRVMQDYHVDFVYSPEHADKVQFRCPFHGKDNKPSARYYRETQSAFCWVCRKRFDVIGFIMEEVGVSFGGALRHLIEKYKIDISSIPDGPNIKYKTPIKKVNIPRIERLMVNIKGNLNGLKYQVPFEKYNILCAVYDVIMFKTSKNIDMIKNAEKLESKIYTLRENL